MIALIASGLLGTLGVLVLVPAATFAIEVAAAFGGRRSASAAGSRPSVAILIPAHNEEGGIGATLSSIKPQLTARDRLLVVADNCTDNTQAAAEAAGAESVSRRHLERRGKGFALDFGLQHLRSSPRDIVILIDADCQVEPGAINLLAIECSRYQRPIQALYLMQNSAGTGLKMRIAEFAWLVKNLVRPLGLKNLGLPCHLTGSGMAFPWASISQMNLANGNIVEDMKMGLDLARLGSAPRFCAEALVLSSFPTQEEGVKNQRTRWEHGHLGTILSEAPGMFLQGFKRLDFALLALAVDLCIPPLALLMLQIAGLWVITAAFYALTGFGTPLLVSSIAAVLFGAAVLAAWITHGRRIVSLSDLGSASLYALWKIPMYVRFVFSRQSEWVRSKRDVDRH